MKKKIHTNLCFFLGSREHRTESTVYCDLILVSFEGAKARIRPETSESWISHTAVCVEDY